MVTGFTDRGKGKYYSTSGSFQQCGSGGASSNGGGNIYAINGPVSGAGALSPGATGADNVLASFFVPQNTIDINKRCLLLSASGNYANTANTKAVKLIVGSASAVVGSTIGGGGTTIGTLATGQNLGWSLTSMILKYGLPGSNTQTGQCLGNLVGTGVGGVALSVALTLPEATGFWVALTGNAATVVTDIVATNFQVEFWN